MQSDFAHKLDSQVVCTTSGNPTGPSRARESEISLTRECESYLTRGDKPSSTQKRNPSPVREGEQSPRNEEIAGERLWPECTVAITDTRQLSLHIPDPPGTIAETLVGTR